MQRKCIETEIEFRELREKREAEYNAEVKGIMARRDTMRERRDQQQRAD